MPLVEGGLSRRPTIPEAIALKRALMWLLPYAQVFRFLVGFHLNPDVQFVTIPLTKDPYPEIETIFTPPRRFVPLLFLLLDVRSYRVPIYVYRRFRSV